MSNNISQPILFQSTAGAIPVRNEKGEVSMQRVKVQRYISGKKPEYAQGVSSGEDSDNEDFMEQRPDRRMHVAPQIIVDTDTTQPQEENDEKEVDDPRLRRLRSIRVEPATRRHEHSPEIIDAEPEESEAESAPESGGEGRVAVAADSSEESEDELDEDEIERRRKMLKEKLAKREAEAEGLGREEEELGIPVADVSESEEDDDGDDYTDSEEETGPRIKPVFVRASERMTVAEREKRAKEQKKQESDAKKEKEERRREAVKLVEDTIRAEQAASKLNEQKEGNINDICTDDENDELEYETWKLRELKRIKRDKDEREALEKEALEIERIRNLTEDERRLEQRINPKQVTNKSSKGKYKFLQKYYHRGAFYLDQEEDVLKQDFSGPTLEDHFDKSVLPKVMQVKKFGRSGRTKYTHLVEQDTTQFDSPWAGDAPRLHANSRQVFHKPSNKRKHSSL